jgi:hypothetical protein
MDYGLTIGIIYAWKSIQKRGRRLLTVPAHRPVKRSTLSHILKQAGLSVEEFNELL